MEITGIDRKRKISGLYKLGNVILDQFDNVYVVVRTNYQEADKKFCLVNLTRSMIADHGGVESFFDSESELEDAFLDDGDEVLSGSFEFKPDSEE